MNILTIEEQQILHLVKTDVDQARYFWARVKSLKWFSVLNKEDYFNPEQIELDENGNASFWNVLDYLERISEQVKKKPKENKSYAVELLKIINEIVEFSKTRKQVGKPLNNYHIWWYCVKILNNIPNDIILEHLAPGTGGDDRNSKYNFRTWLEEWISSSFGDSLITSDIGGNLLGKFLKDAKTIPYAETIINIITEIRAGSTKNVFSEREDARLICDSCWILDSFQKYHKEIGAKCSDNIVYDLADKLKKTMKYEQKSNRINLDMKNNDNDCQLKVSRVPKEGLKDGEIGFKESYYECVVRQYVPEQMKDIDKKKDPWLLYNIEPQKELKRFFFTANTKEIFISKIKKNLPSGIDWQKAEDFERELQYLFEGLYEDYSQIWIRSLESGSSFHSNEAKDVLTIILRDVLLARCEIKKEKNIPIFKKFISSEYPFPIFKRYVLLYIDKYWDDYSELFNEFFKTAIDVFDRADFEVELYDVLHNNNMRFSDNLINELKKLLKNTSPEYYRKKSRIAVAHWKYRLLSALKDNPGFSDMYKKAKKQAKIKDDKSYKPERSTFKSGFISHKSPLSKEEILSKPIAELIKFLKEFEGADSWHGTFEGEPDREGLCDALQSAVKENPEKFAKELGLFNQQGLYRYVSSILLGFIEALRGGELLSWGKIFDFSQKYVKQPWFLGEASNEQRRDSGGGKYIWVVDTIVDLIEEGSKDNKQAFGHKYSKMIESIFNSLLSLVKGEEHPDTERDTITYALNTTLGRVTKSYIVFSLRASHVREKNNEGKEKNWGKKYERFFEKGIEAYIWFGRYLLNIRYLDQKYTDEKIKLFSKLAMDDYNWQMFMEGYLTGSYVYDAIYPLMRLHYIRAIEGKVFEKRVAENLVQHITIGYLRKHELLKEKNTNGKDSLFWKMLDEAGAPNKHERWLEVASFFWSISPRIIKKDDESKSAVSKDSKKKILEFWKWTADNKNYVKTKLETDYPSFLDRMSELTIFLNKIDKETGKWLMLSAPYIGRHHMSGFFIEYLTKFEDDESVKRIGKIFLKILENNTPRFKQENIQLIVKRLYDLNEKDPKKYSDVKKDVDEICTTYGRRGINFLKNLFYEHQQNT